MEKRIIINDQLITKYLSGEAMPEEAMALHNWIAIPENKRYFEKFEAVWQMTNPIKKQDLVNKHEDWILLNRRTTKILRLSSLRINLTVSNRLFLKTAAALFAGLMLSAVAYSVFKKADVYTENNIETFRLPDKSEITLNQNTKLKYSKRFGTHQREVYFSGEAFFRVKTDSTKPFIIHTDLANIMVKGTSFNVIVTDKRLEASVSEGEIMVYTRFDSCFVHAGQSAVVYADLKRINSGIPANVNNWGYATHKFEFKNTPLKDVFFYFSKAYSDSIQIRNENINNCKITTVFDNNSVEYMLTLIAETLDLKLMKNDDIFVLEGKGCP